MIGIGFVVVGFVLIMNNMLVMLVGVLVIDGVNFLVVICELMIYVNVVGNDFGFKFILIGLFVILLWLYVFVGKG